jgi:hypothetical protein
MKLIDMEKKSIVTYKNIKFEEWKKKELKR